MNIATKAALYNALLFPGWGHIYLKKYKRGMLIIFPVLAGILSICWTAFQIAEKILKATPFRKGTVDITSVVNLSINSVREIDPNYSLVLLPIALLWIFSIVDAYKLGKKQILEISAKTET